jgi:paraquat-inducible protein A
MTELSTCRCCGLIQRMPIVPDGMEAICTRCGTPFRTRMMLAASETAAIALAALILYPIAVSLPIMKIERFGHHTDTSILNGIASMFSSGQVFVGVVVLLCSVVFPLGKLISLLALSLGGLGMAHHHKAFTYRLVEWTGRWGMLDVLLVAVLIAALKLGNMMEVTPGPAAAAFAICVLLSLLATARFDPHSLWESEAILKRR